MPNTPDVAAAGDRMISAVEKAQGAYVKAVSSVSRRVGDMLPAMPGMPFVDRLPSPVRVVETGFGITERIISTQKSYALDLLKAVSPVTEKVVPGLTMTKRRRTTKASS